MSGQLYNTKFPSFNPTLDYVENITNPFYIEKQTEVNLGSSDTRDFIFMMTEWFVIFSFIMQINILLYKFSQLRDIRSIFSKKGHEQFNQFLSQKKIEYQRYAIILVTMSALQMMQSLIQYFLWRGLNYFSIPEPTRVPCRLLAADIGPPPRYQLNCSMTGLSRNQTFDYQKYSLNCGSSTVSSQFGSNCIHCMISDCQISVAVGIALWYLVRYLIGTFNLFFSLMLLGRNKKGSRGKNLINTHLKKAFFYNSIILAGQMILLFKPYNYRLYFRFETLGVLIIYLFEKVLLFFLLFDKYIVKEWTEGKLKSKHVHIKGIQWREEYNQAMRLTFDRFRDKLGQKKAEESFFKERSVELQAIYEENFQRYAEEEIFQKHFWAYDHKPEKLFELSWTDYINYQLIVTAMGIIGYFLMMLPTAQAYEGKRQLEKAFYESQHTIFMWGWFFALAEILLLKITKDIFLTNVLFRQITTEFESRSKKLRCQYISDFQK